MLPNRTSNFFIDSVGEITTQAYKGDFTVKGTLASNIDQEVTLEVVDMIGQVIYTSKVTAQGGNINEHVKLNNLANGMYLLNMRSGDESVVFHFVIEQ